MDRRIISSLYRDQKAGVEMQGERGEASIRKGVRQHCWLTPSLYNLYSEEAINKIEDEIKNIVVKVRRNTMKMLRFADDIALLTNTKRELEEALNAMETVFIIFKPEPEPVSLPTRIPLNVQTKAQLKIS